MPFNTILDHKVASITYAGKEDVYNITVEDNHNYFVVSNYRADKTSTGVCLKNCAESTLLDREACCLGSINLVRHINSEKKFDWEKFSTSIKIGIRFLDDLLEKSPYPDPSVKKAVFNTRKVGLGIMGFADVLIMLGIKYSSPEACKFADQLGSFMRKVAEQESTKLGKEKGCYEAYKEGCPKRRNAIVLTFAPTGSISLIAGVSSGIEPNFAASYSRTFYPENEVVTLNHPWKDKPCFEVAQDIPPEQHLKVLASFQKHVDNAVSKTINCPESTTIDDIKKLIIMGHELGVKGLTIFRKNCKRKSLIKCDGEQCLL
jgi:ribonucleoside-diphosphate reductase alpha chain